MMNEMHLALHGLAIKKHAGPAAVAATVGLSETRVAELLQQAVTTGRASEAQGAYLLSPAGRLIIESLYSKLFDRERQDGALAGAYEKFERINTELKQLITDWQTLDVGGQKVRNDHSNKDYDARVLDRLGALHERFTPVLAQLCRGVPRLDLYREKLDHALDRAEAGQVQWVSDAKIDSFHTVWFEMHEDLLRILGLQREE
ncbi:MAG: hypothetical protein HYX63_18860 [Gammaproteobacteria bacterium]|nr:hypothetical protein [Gammaproteobacteria bacterium]